jgi:glutamate dehydrogenase/leucine dehydrogenase
LTTAVSELESPLHRTALAQLDTIAALLEQECDVLAAAAVGSHIHGDDADRVKAALIVEGANEPTTAEADAILHERGAEAHRLRGLYP